MQRKFITYCILFFIPVLVGYTILERLTLKLPSSFSINQKYIESKKNNIETLILGSSQIDYSVNPEWLDSPTINLASGWQHHDTDFKLLKALSPSFKNLKTVVLEVSYSHFELAHNGKDFWKNSLYLTYYKVNTFERSTNYKDHLLYITNPPFFSNNLYEYYISDNDRVEFNQFGFNLNNYKGDFKELNYNKAEIEKIPKFSINTSENLTVFETNTNLFFNMLDYLKDKNLSIIICKVPMYKSYLLKRNAFILARRDSILQIVMKKYPEIQWLDKEEDTINYNVKDYKNHNHLNPDGARKFTKSLNTILNKKK